MKHLHPIRWLFACAAAVAMCGCQSQRGPDELVISAQDYDAAFDAAIEAARRAGMPAVLRDRRNGVIETEPRIAGSILEPWRTDNASFSQALANTINLQRRRVRFEFAPADAPPPDLPVQPDQPLTGADYAGVSVSPIDLTQYVGDIRIACIVVLERNHRPGMRHSTWTARRLAGQAQLGGRDAGLPSNFWTPVSRDTAYESRLLREIETLK